MIEVREMNAIHIPKIVHVRQTLKTCVKSLLLFSFFLEVVDLKLLNFFLL